ncbi:hypothetical protein [Phocaeicola sp.]
MKITNVNKGKPYHLSPDTKLKVERPNLFFNEYGEQTNPMSLPDTGQNRELLEYPDLISKRQKLSASIMATIEDEGYFMPCRQAVLSAQRKEAIETSFYMNEGSFLSKISDTSLIDVFGTETISGLTTIEECIAFCRSLIPGNNPHYAIFPVLIDSDGSSYDDGTPKLNFINRYGFVDSSGNFRDYNFHAPYTAPDFYNAVSRTVADGDFTISLSPGYYMSPFIRGNYLLERIFSYFGYTLNENFFTRTVPFTSMVFVNNCADTIVNGVIRITDLLPDCSCNTILEVYRKKFCCEFIPDEVNHTVDIVLFNDVVKMKPQQDLTPYLTSHLKIDYPDYCQLILSSDEQVASPQEVETFDSIADLLGKYKSAELDSYDGAFYRKGYCFLSLLGSVSAIPLSDKIAESSMRYYAGGNLETEEITVPDCQPVFCGFYNNYVSGITNYNKYEDKFLYIGKPNFLNSKLQVSKTAEVESLSEETITSDAILKPMLAFAYTINDFPRGTTSNYGLQYSSQNPQGEYVRLFDYTLCYNGSDGIFERFYRSLDDIYRNSMHSVTAKLLLPADVKQSLVAHLPVNLQGENLLINILKYTIGGKTEPQETSFYTYRFYNPVDSAKQFADYMPDTDYEWLFEKIEKAITEAQYNSSPYKDKEFVTVFLPPASQEYANSKKYFVQHSALSTMFGGTSYYNEFEIWFTCIEKTNA